MSKEVLEEYNWWKKSDSLCLKFLRLTTAPNIKSSISETGCNTASKYMEIIKECFQTTDKAVAGRLMSELTTAKYNESVTTMQQHVLHMTNLAAKLGKLGIKVEDPFLAQFIINSLPDKFDAFHLHYNTVKEIWSVNELTNKLVQEAARIKQKDEADASSKSTGLS
ncbi:uncharacterized protein LOC141588477 [Silene latifolia]|uniref:uncharacterized protein LOC141588477 n=1 Tax=Silene latifolia TaxID=37657 RepID=UPI003D783901